MSVVRVLAAAVATLFVTLFFGVTAATPAAADTAQVVLTSAVGTVARSDGRDTVSFTLTNPTENDAKALLVGDGASCRPSPVQDGVPKRLQSKVTFAIDGCSIAEGATLPMTLQVSGTSFPVSVTRESANPHWQLLWAFPKAVGAAAICVVIGYLMFLRRADGELCGKATAFKPLPYLSATWSFKDSWATNVTLVSAVFTGLFGTSDLLKTITGAEQPSALALVTVAGGIAVAVVGAAPLALQILRTSKGEPLIFGLLTSATLAVGAAGALISIIADTAAEILPDSIDPVLNGAKVTGLVVLAVYAICSIRQNLAMGLREPDVPPPSDDKLTVIVQVREVADSGSGKLEMTGEKSFETSYPIVAAYPRGTSPGDTYPAALL